MERKSGLPFCPHGDCPLEDRLKEVRKEIEEQTAPARAFLGLTRNKLAASLLAGLILASASYVAVTLQEMPSLAEQQANTAARHDYNTFKALTTAKLADIDQTVKATSADVRQQSKDLAAHNADLTRLLRALEINGISGARKR